MPDLLKEVLDLKLEVTVIRRDLAEFKHCSLEMGQSSADAEVRPNVRLGSARQCETIWPKFSRTSANIRRHWGFELAAFCARRWRLTKVNTLTISY